MSAAKNRDFPTKGARNVRTHTRRQAAGVFAALLIISLVVTGFPTAADANGYAETFADTAQEQTTEEV